MPRKASELNTAHPTLGTTPRVLITAGPTHEPIDAVRYIANRSSGRMGLALARACDERGWQTTLLLGPTALPPPDLSHGSVQRFQTAADLERLLQLHWPQHDLLIMAAAVADFTPVHANEHEKIKRSNRPITIALEPTPDLLASLVATTRPDQAVVGFALEEADQLIESALSKLRAKKLDAIVANPLPTMDSPTITATVAFADGRIVNAPPQLAKEDFARWLLAALESLIDSRVRGRAESAR
jgi:phosphopantothenoylcysteine decarboxylase/phosphopantothenate--cysteine ligase